MKVYGYSLEGDGEVTKLKRNQYILAALVLIVIAIIASSSLFQQAAVLTAQQINIDSQGYEEGGKVKGTFWSVVMTASMSDQVSFYEFDDSDVPTGTTWNGKDVEVKNRIRIEVDPAQPYYERSIVRKSYVVVPDAYRNWVGVASTSYGRDKGTKSTSPLLSNVYETSTSTWELHTPFTLRVYKNGELVGSAQMDLFASGISPYQNVALDGKDVKIGDTKNYLMFESLGALLGGYESPNWQSVIGWTPQYLYLNSPTVQKAMHSSYPPGDSVSASTSWMNQEDYRGTYAWYWFGEESSSYGDFNWYWRDDGTPCPIQNLPNYAWQFVTILGEGATPGWVADPEGTTGYQRVIPRQAYKFPTEQPSETQQYYSLTEYLEAVVHAQKVSELMPSWEPNSNNIHIDSPSGKLRIYLPFNAYNPLFVIRISSELADTVVWEPPVANIKITKVNGQATDPNTEIDLGSTGDRKSVSITLQNQGNVTASGTVHCQPIDENASWAFEPQAFGTGPMQPNEERTFDFDVVDLTTTEEGTYKFKVSVYNVLGGLTDYRIFKITLLPRGVGACLLYVNAIDKVTKLDVAGIHATVTYNDQTDSFDGFTPFTHDFEGSTPYVSVVSVETDKYKSAAESKQLEFGVNKITLELEPLDYEETGFEWWLLLLIFFLIVGGVALLVGARKKRKGKTTRKRRKISILKLRGNKK